MLLSCGKDDCSDPFRSLILLHFTSEKELSKHS